MHYYSNEKNVQILISLLKQHGIKRIVASPGTTNVPFIASVQQDSFFEIYSCVDERAAAYMACGLAEESGDPVVISCTGATASRNYPSALTEAFYSKLPVLAVTSSQYPGRIGHNVEQVIDRRAQMNDICNISVEMPTPNCEEDEWFCSIQANKAILELKHRGGGPAHINLCTVYDREFSVKNLPVARMIQRYEYDDQLPKIDVKKVAIFIGNHHKWEEGLTEAVDLFCEKYNGVVLHDHSSKYKGKYGVFIGTIPKKVIFTTALKRVELLINIGNVSASQPFVIPDEVWRVNPDGEIRDTYKKLTKVFEMKEMDFFNRYCEITNNSQKKNHYYEEFNEQYKQTLNEIPELPFSNAWLAQQTSSKIPANSVLHLAILNSLKTWNYFETNKSVITYANTGGFGIDGILATLLGASLANPQKTYFCVLGDLAFFYDMNTLGNRHVGKNLRILLVNNNGAHTMRSITGFGHVIYDDGDRYITAKGHFEKFTNQLVKHYAEDLGFKYISASNKGEYLKHLPEFLCTTGEQSVVFEVFTDSELENQAEDIMRKVGVSSTLSTGETVAKKILGEAGFESIKKKLKK